MKSIIEIITLATGKMILKPINITRHQLFPKYQNYLPVINSCYEEAYYWHGTGRYHYKLKGESKYDGIDFSQTYDVLQSIIDYGGITPKFDPVVTVNRKYINSISLTPYRMYGRAYDEFNQPQGEDLQYTFGSVKFWFYFLLPLQLFHRNVFLNLKGLWIYYRNKDFIDNTIPWTHTFVRPIKFR